jgi:exodeoxyribonuclease V beta subunit
MYRLEEDSDAVQIVTVHSAKGLEFDFVFCPYLWSTMSAPRTHQPILVRRENSWTLSDGEQKNNHEARLIAATDRLMEDLRLTYVALTRARRRVTFLAGPLGYSSRSALPPSSLDWLLRTEEQSGAFEDWYTKTEKQNKDPSACEHGDTLQSLQAANPSVITVSAPPVATETIWTSNQHRRRDIHTRPLPVLKFDAWQMTSFSKLAHGRQEERERQDAMLPAKSPDAADTTFEATDSIVPLANFPRGIRTGHCLHELLEHWDFQEDTEPIVKRSLRRYRLLSGKAEIDIRNTLEQLKTVHLQHMDVDLKTAAADKNLSEWEFLLPLNHNGISGYSLSKVFNKHARNDTERLYALDLAGLPEQTLSGMLTGYIDRIIRANDVWGIADWKSNYLGSCYNQYRQEDLWNCAADQHYLLQVHLYLVALRRYLKERAPQATAASGYLVFLRGISPKQEDGVLEISPPDGLLEDLDELLNAAGSSRRILVQLWNDFLLHGRMATLHLK